MPVSASQRRKRGSRRPLAVVVVGCALALLSTGGVASADLQARIDAAKAEAESLEAQIQARGERIATLEDEVDAAQAKIESLTAELASGEQRSAELSGQLGTAQTRLSESQASLERARGILATRLVDIYKHGEPSYLELALSSDGFDDLTSRAGYLRAFQHADSRVADRVQSLTEAVKERIEEIDDLKAQIDDHNRSLAAARHGVAESRAAMQEQAAELAGAKADENRDLAQIRSNISDLKAQLGSQQLGALFGNGNWAIPEYIVMCESGGNYHAVNASSGAGGAYQIMPATWASYGGKGLPQDAPPEEQDRIAALIYADSGSAPWTCA